MMPNDSPEVESIFLIFSGKVFFYPVEPVSFIRTVDTKRLSSFCHENLYSLSSYKC